MSCLNHGIVSSEAALSLASLIRRTIWASGNIRSSPGICW